MCDILLPGKFWCSSGCFLIPRKRNFDTVLKCVLAFCYIQAFRSNRNFYPIRSAAFDESGISGTNTFLLPFLSGYYLYFLTSSVRSVIPPPEILQTAVNQNEISAFFAKYQIRGNDDMRRTKQFCDLFTVTTRLEMGRVLAPPRKSNISKLLFEKKVMQTSALKRRQHKMKFYKASLITSKQLIIPTKPIILLQSQKLRSMFRQYAKFRKLPFLSLKKLRIVRSG